MYDAMSAGLNAYLSSRYLVADSKPTKKRKRKQKASNGLFIVDDDDTAWSQDAKPRQGEHDDTHATVVGTSADFRKSQNSSWKTVFTSEGHSRAGDSIVTAAADAVLASAVAENEVARHADDEFPVVADSYDIVTMSDGTHAGLQTAAALDAQLKERQREERAEVESIRKGAKEEEASYRDAAGTRIDVALRRAEARKVAIAEADEKERRAKEALRGDVQREEARRRRERLEDAKFMTISRRADDEEMNRELRDKQRWNDPMAQFITSAGNTSIMGKKAKGRPVYTGPSPPNRYDIRPGYRWDGVDRGNGLEAERFKSINRRERIKAMEYSWQMDV